MSASDWYSFGSENARTIAINTIGTPRLISSLRRRLMIAK